MLSLIVAASENNVIGHLNKIPWHMPRDLKHFAGVTKNHTVIMGRNTYQSIFERLGKPLPERNNVVVTRNTDFKAPGCTVVHSLEEALNKTAREKEVFVIGGSQLYVEALPTADKIYRTLIHATIEGDAFFPTLNPAEWKLVESKFEAKDDKNPFDANYETYERVRSQNKNLTP
ncbi:MAG: dihydrofolate reductase [Candidatus Taylorbacteria bacterium]|nr:dihydrofolate reductase [Candidatus Taylorbacteria bacterium]